jgi:hypothetical protein
VQVIVNTVRAASKETRLYYIPGWHPSSSHGISVSERTKEGSGHVVATSSIKIPNRVITKTQVFDTTIGKCSARSESEQ